MKTIKIPFSLSLCNKLNTQIELIPDVNTRQVLITVSKIEEGKLKDNLSLTLDKEEIKDLIKLLTLSYKLTKSKNNNSL